MYAVKKPDELGVVSLSSWKDFLPVNSSKLMQKALANDDSMYLYPDEPSNEGVESSKGWLQDYKKHENLLRNDPVQFCRVWYAMAKGEVVGQHQGDPFSPEIYLNCTVKEKLADHSTLWRMAKMCIEVEKLHCAGQHIHARAQNLANFKAVHKALSKDGKWREAWAFTYMNELGATESGSTMSERLAIGKMLKEQAALEELLAKENERPRKKK